MRLLLDTNTVLSALLWQGKPYRLLAVIRAQHPNIQLYSSSAILAEITEVIARPFFTERLTKIGKRAQDVLADYIEVVELIEPVNIPAVSRDPKDDKVLACALAARADALVTGDKDLLVLKEHQGIPILTADQCLNQLQPADKTQ